MRRLEVEYASRSCALVRGYGARELITEVRGRGRGPVWATLSRAWVCQPSTAVDVIAVAETRGYLVLTTGQAPTSSRSDADRGDRRGIVLVGGDRADSDNSTGRPARPTSSSDGLW